MAHVSLILVFLLQLLLLGAVSFFIVRALVQIVSDRTDVPFVRTPKRTFATIAETLDIRPGESVFELGSGDGGFLLWCAARYPDARFTGIERNPLLHYYASYRQRRAQLKNLSFVRGNLFEMNFSGARKMYAYLLNPVMDRLLPKLEREFHGTLASRAFRFKAKQPVRTIELSSKKGWHGEHLLHLYDFL